MLSIRLPEDIELRITKLAKRTHRTKTFYATEAIITHLEDMEDGYEAMELLKECNGPYISHEDLMKECGIDNDLED